MTNGCISSATVIVINPIPASPSITLVSQTNISCSGLADGALDVSVNGGLAPYVVSWNPNVGTGTSISNLTPGNYSINVIDANGCSTSETYIVTSPSPLVVTGVANDIVCGVFLGSITTSVNGGTGPFTYAWSPNSEVTPDLNNLYVGIYVVTVTDVNGCQDSESFDIALSGNLTLDITPPSASINEGDTIDLSVTGATSYIWTPSTGLSCNDCPNPIATPDVTTTYTVSGTDAAGCTGTASILIYVEQYCKDFFVPNIFSPNGKGPDVNNTLCVYGSCIVELQYEVFNRWGEKVFETTDTSICWDGNWRGEPVGSGVFAYKLRAVLSNGEIVEKAGNLTVVY
jgi:gliding motility-associated-like protein